MTESLVDLFCDMEWKLASVYDTIPGKIWATDVIKMKNKKICELTTELFPDIMKALDEKYRRKSLAGNTQFSHLVYNDFD